MRTKVPQSVVGGFVKSDGGMMGEGQLDLSKTVLSNVGEDMNKTNDRGGLFPQ